MEAAEKEIREMKVRRWRHQDSGQRRTGACN